MDAMPLHEASAALVLEPFPGNGTRVIWGMDYRVKYGPLGWLLGRTLMKMMMGKVLDATLNGLAEKLSRDVASTS
jgi:carbon monoxide dehydrogenase subunit G